MGRTYKRNDLHNSRRPKSIREKRHQFGKNKQQYSDTYEDNFSTGKQQQRNLSSDYNSEDYNAWMTLTLIGLMTC